MMFIVVEILRAARSEASSVMHVGVRLAMLVFLLAPDPGYTDDKTQLSVRLPATSVAKLNLSLDKACVHSVVGNGPVYESASVDVLCVLKNAARTPPGIKRLLFQMHGYFPSSKAPDEEKPYPITGEDRKLLETLGPIVDPAPADFPIAGQITDSSRTSPPNSYTVDGEGRKFFWTAETIWLASKSIRSLPTHCTTMRKSVGDAENFAPILSQCMVFLNYDEIELVAFMDVTSPITVGDLEYLLSEFEIAVVVKN
jgi:hypothetical protein